MQRPTISQRFSIFTFAIVLCAANYAQAQAGSLDPTFGTGGIFSSPTTRGSASAIAIQSDGKIVVAGGGVANNGFADILFRLNTNGTLDSTFGSGGLVTIDNEDGFFALAIQPNGKIVAAGEGNSGTAGSIVQVARFNSNGSLDKSFGTGGFTTTTAIPFTPFNATVALGLQSNGDLLVAASSPGLLARFTSSGQLDTTFGTGGIANLANVGPALTDTAPSLPTKVIALADGKILVSAGVPGPTPAAVASVVSRYNSNGSLDTTFGAAGMAASVVSASAMALESNGRIVIAGAVTSKVNVPPASNDVGFGIVRYTANGNVDTTFGTGGAAIVDFGAAAPLSGPFAVAIQSNGDVVAGGAAALGPENSSVNSAFGLIRVTSSGVLDTTFGSDGIVITTIQSGSPVFSFVTGLAIQSDGKIVAAGTTLPDLGFISSSANVARYLSQ
jgi:uncharacterized delta-60 repeat protein